MNRTTTQSTKLSETHFNKAFIQSLLFLLFLFGIQNSFAQKTWDGGAGTSNWGDANNWNSNTLPTSTDNVTIGNGVTVVLNVDATVASLTVGGTSASTFTVGSGNQNRTFTVSGNVTVNSGVTFTSTGNGGNTMNIGGNLTNTGSFSDNSGDMSVIFNGGSQTISGAGTFSFTNFLFSTAGTKTINSSIDVAGNWTNNGGTVTGTGTVTLSGTCTIGGSSSTAFPNLTVTGTITQSINTSVTGNFNKTAGTYNIASSTTSYTLAVTGNFSNSGGTFRVANGANSASLTVGGTFSLSGGTFVIQNTTNATGGSVTVSGSTTISGTGVLIMDNAGASATCSFNAVDFNATGTGGSSNDGNRTNCSIDFGLGTTVNHCQFKISGNFVHSSTNVFYTSTTTQVGSIIFNKTGTQTLNYSGSNSAYTSMTVNSGSTLQLLSGLTFNSSSGLPASTFLVNGTLDAKTFTLSGASTGSEFFTLASGATFITANTNGVVSSTSGSISTSMTRSFSNGANYVFNGTANQTANLGNTTLNNLTISNTGGSVTLNAAITATGNLTINSGSSLTGGNLTHAIAGNWTNDGGSFVTGTGTINLNGTAQTIGGTSSSINFNNLTVSGGTKSFVKPVAIAGNLSIASGAIVNPGSITTHTANTLTLGGVGTAAAKFGSTATTATPTVYKTDTYFTSGSLGYITVTASTCTTTISTASIASNNATTSLAKNGDIVTVSFTTSETPSVTPTATINGFTASVSGSGTSWTATRTVSGDTNGLATFSLAIQNAFGCTASRSTVTNGSSVTIDTNPPIFTVISIASNNANNAYAKTGNTITVSFTTSETPSATPTATINGSSATVSGSGTSWTASRTVAGGDTNGVVPFSVNIRDVAGNSTTGNTTTNSSSVTVDTVSPTIATASIASNNANPSLAKSGDVITLNFTTSEALSATPTVTISGGAASVSGSGLSWSASRTVLNGDTNGLASFAINITDIAGNSSSRTTTTDSSSVTIDTVAPTIPSASIASNNAITTLAKAGNTISLTFTTSQTPLSTPIVAINGLAANVSGSGTSWSATRVVAGGDNNGIVPFSISIADAAGNSTTKTTTTDGSSVTVDTIAPSFLVISIASNNTNPSVAGTGDVVTVNFTTQEAIAPTPVVIIEGTAASVNGSGTSWSASKTISSCSGNVATFSISLRDLAGNNASRSTTTDASQVTINPTPSATIVSNGGTICVGSNAIFTVNGSNGATLNYTITGQSGTQQLLLNGANQVISALNAGSNITLTLVSVVNANCSSSGFVTSTSTVTVNPLPIVTASNVTGCSGTSIALVGSGSPSGGSGSFSVANPYVGTSSTTYTYTYTGTNGCSATSAPANIIITPQPSWYLDADGDQYYTGAAVLSCASPGAGYTTNTLLGGGDCDDANSAINPGVADICYNNIDENCNGIKSDSCAPVVVNMTASYHNSTLPSLSVAVPAVAYTYGSETNLKYRFSIKNETTGVSAPDIIQVSRYVTIPAVIHSFNSQYSIKVSAVINEEVVPFAGNTIIVNSPTVQMITLNTANCGATLASLASTLTANAGLNAIGYTFRIRLNDSNPSPVYAYSQSSTRFVGANSFTGFPLQYSTSYKVSVQYSFTDPVTNLVVESGYGSECTVNTPSIPLTNLASPACNSQVAAMNANITASAASYATSYQFRIRLFNDNGPNPTYYYSAPNPSRFSSLTAFQGITWAYNTFYAISVQYSVQNGSTTVWSGYGAECKIKTPFFPVTSLIPSQCGLSTPTALNQQLNISPYPGFPHYKVKLEEIDGEDVVSFEEREITYPHFKLSDFSIAQPGKTYNVSVAIKLNGVFGDYDTACDLFTEALSKTTIPVSFKASTYPNPFADNFMIDIKSGSQSIINIKVYDMMGRLVEKMDLGVSEIQNITIGNQYPSGVYNVIVSQDDSTQTLRVVKR